MGGVMREVEDWVWGYVGVYQQGKWVWKQSNKLVRGKRNVRMSVADPRAELAVKIKTVLDAKAMLRFVHRMQHRKKTKPIGLVYTKVDLAGLVQETSLTMKSSLTPQRNSDMIRYFGKDLLISGFLRQFSHNTVYDDVETLCLQYYHLCGAAHEYQRKYTRNEWLQCFKYNELVEWEERQRNYWGHPEEYKGTSFLCLSTLWDGANEGRPKNAQLYSLLPVYRVSLEENNEETNWSGNRSAETCKKARNRYIERKWSAYHKLNRM